MIAADKFLLGFMRDLLKADPLDRAPVISDWALKLEERDAENRQLESDLEPEEEG